MIGISLQVALRTVHSANLGHYLEYVCNPNFPKVTTIHAYPRVNVFESFKINHVTQHGTYAV